MKLFLFIVSGIGFIGSILTFVISQKKKKGYSLPTAQSSSDTILTACIIVWLVSCIGLAKTSVQMKINKG